MENKKNKIEEGRYSITAYLIELRERQKFYGDHTKDNVVDKTEYINNPTQFVHEFLAHLEKDKSVSDNSYLCIYDSKIMPDKDIAGVELFVNYGKSGQDFLTVKKSGEEQKFDRDTKIVKYYKVFLVIKDDNAFLVIFREGVNSCKTAFFDEMRVFLDNTNVIVSLPYVSNNEYLNKLYDNMTLVNLNYETMYKELSNDNADDSTYISKRYSLTSIDLTLGSSLTKFGQMISNWFKGLASRDLISEVLRTNVDNGVYSLNEESMSVVVMIGGVKRTVPLNKIASFYDVDITSRLEYDSKNIPTNESIVGEVIEYIKGIKLPEN